jgi:hypothetical protein
VKTAQARSQVGAIARDQALRLAGYVRSAVARVVAYRCRPALPHRSRLVARMRARSVCAGRDRRKRAIDGSVRTFGLVRQTSEIIIEIGVLDLDEIAAFERINAGLYLRP